VQTLREIAMKRERPEVEFNRHEKKEREPRKEALHVLLEARERLLSQMAEDILAHRDVLLDGTAREEFSSFELAEIEDRYSARLNALNSLLENLEYRHPRVRHRVETLTTTHHTLKKDLNELLDRFDQWDLVNIAVTSGRGDELLVIAALTADEYPE